MANIVEILLKANTTQAMGAMKGFTNALDQTVQSLTGFSLTQLGSAAVIGKVVDGIKEAVDEYSNYATAIGKAAEISGVTAEEMSRLVQAADDVFVSQEALTRAFQMSLKNGFVPTIENLAKLSDELLGMKDPAERAEKASKIFGRQWAEIAPFILQGGDAIRETTDAIADGLIVTDQAVQENIKYKQSLDEWNDSITAIKNTLGKDFLPVLTDILQLMNQLPKTTDTNVEAWRRFLYAIPGVGLALQISDSNFYNNRAEQEKWKEAVEDSGSAARQMPDALGAMSAALADTSKNISDVTDTSISATDAMKKYNTQLLFTIASQNLDADAALGLASALGLVDGSTLYAMQRTQELASKMDGSTASTNEYIRAVAELNRQIMALQDRSVTITVNTVYAGGANSGLGQDVKPSGYTDYLRASGGPVEDGKPYIVGEKGPEMFVPNSNGSIVPNDKLGGTTINIYANGYSQVDASRLAANVARAIQGRR